MPAAKKQSIWRPAKFALFWKRPTRSKPAMTQYQAMGRKHKDTETQRGQPPRPRSSGDVETAPFVSLCLCVFFHLFSGPGFFIGGASADSRGDRLHRDRSK